MPSTREQVLSAVRAKYPDVAEASDAELLDALRAEAGGGNISNNEVIRLTKQELQLPDQPTDASFGGAVRNIPRGIAEMGIAAAKGPVGPLQYAANAMVDVFKASIGDQEAADRAGGRDAAMAMGSMLIPGGPVAGGARALATRAAVGGATAGSLAASSGASPKSVAEQAATGAALSAFMPPAARFVAKEFKPLVQPIERYVRSLGVRGYKASGNIVTAPGGERAVFDTVEEARAFARKATNDLRHAAQKVSQEAIAGEGAIHPSIARLTQALEEAKPLRVSQDVAVSAERARRFQRFEEVGTKVSGESGAHAQLSQLAGELPKRHVDFEALRQSISQDDVNSLYDIIKTNPAFSGGEITTGFRALGKLLGEGGGVVPQPGEIEILQSAFGPKFVDTLLKHQSTFAKARRLGIEIVNVPRAIMSSYDLSAPLRQGAFLVGRPKQFLSSFVRMFKLIGSQRASDALNAEIRANPYARYMGSSHSLGLPGLALTDIGGVLGKREEAFMGNLAERIPIIGAGVRASQRAYVGFLNKLRADTFVDILKNAERAGHDINNPKFIRDLQNFVNMATGRGQLPGKLERLAPELSTMFFSPRLIASRVNIMRTAFTELPGVRQGLGKVGYEALDPVVRKEFYKTLASTGMIAGSVLGLMAAAGAAVEKDPRSSDFGKIRIGNTRFDIFAGFQQYIRLGMQIAPNFGIDALPTAGVKYARSSTLRRYGRGFNAPTRLKQVGDFMENKLAPVPALMIRLMRGEEKFRQQPRLATASALIQGRPLPPATKRPDNLEKAVNVLSPIVISDIIEAMAEWGPETGMFMATPAVFGVGIGSYPSPQAQPSPRPESLLERVFQRQKKERKP